MDNAIRVIREARRADQEFDACLTARDALGTDLAFTKYQTAEAVAARTVPETLRGALLKLREARRQIHPAKTADATFTASMAAAINAAAVGMRAGSPDGPGRVRTMLGLSRVALDPNCPAAVHLEAVAAWYLKGPSIVTDNCSYRP